MPSNIASILCALFVLAAFFLNRDHVKLSRVLWLPAIWLFLSASRMPSQWILGGALDNDYPGSALIEGNSFDASIFAGLILAGLLALLNRAGVVWVLLRKNWPLVLFFAYCLLSVLWSDFPVVAFKRLIKAVGDLVMVLLVLTDLEPTAALKRVFSRVGFVLIPLSILLIRYYPVLGRAYSSWTGEAYNIGVATGKNGLGYVCLVFGLGSAWCLFQEFGKQKKIRKRVALAQIAVLALSLWLFSMAHSATSFSCFLIGTGLIAFLSLRAFRTPKVVHGMVASLLFLVLYGLLLSPESGLVHAVGRDATLTGRTAIWGQVLDMTVSPMFGAGYESFWLGERLQRMWSINGDRPNQAHNGYLEVYLDLGWVGIALVGAIIIWGYRNAVRTLRWDPGIGQLKLACFVIAAVYNVTEHAFRELHPVWILFLLAVTAVPKPSNQEAT